MSEQAKITDFFQSARRPTRSVSRKRKVIDSPAAQEDITSAITPTKRDRLMFTNRSRLMVQMAQKLSPLKNAATSNNTTDTNDNAKSAARNLTEKLDNAATEPQTDNQSESLPADLNGNDVVSTVPAGIGVKDHAKIVLSPLKFNMSKPILTSPLKAPLKSPPKRPIPAFQRFSHLLDDEVSSLFLPKKYKLLADTFTCMDRAMSLLMRQKQQTSFDRIRSSVELMSGRRFDVKKLLQLKTAFPESFILKYDSSVSDKQQVSQLTTALVIIPTRKKDSSDSELMAIELKPSVVTSRKIEMHRKLIEVTKVEHEKFLQSLDPPIKVDNRKLAKWHRNFPIDDVPDIVPDESFMPVNPHKKEEQTVDIVLQRMSVETSKSDVTVIPRTASSLSSSSSMSNKAGEKIKSGHLKGLDVAFVERIKAREAANTAKELTRSPVAEKKIVMLQESSTMIRTVRSYFVGEGKTTLLKDAVIRKIIDSSSSFISYEEVDERLMYLTEVLPSWIMIFQVKKGSYVKVQNMNRKLTDLEQEIEKKIASLRDTAA